jgi:hypothetical protein
MHLDRDLLSVFRVGRATLCMSLSLASAVGASNATAQVAATDCAAIADTVAAGYSTYLSENRLEALRYYANCEAQESAQSGALDVVYKAFSLGARYDQSKKQSSCTKDQSQLKTHASEYARVKQVFRDGVEVVSQCLQLAGRSWNIKYKLYKDAVSFNVANLSPNGSQLRGIDIISTEGLSCKDAPATYPVTIKAEGLSVLCTRTPKTQTVGGNTFSEAADAEINLRLADGPFAIRLPGYASSSLDAVYAEIETVRKELRGSFSALKTSQHSPLPTAGGNAATALCPVGTYMVGARVKSDPGGCCGQISAMFPICRSILP